jgi:hypothetical protein
MATMCSCADLKVVAGDNTTTAINKNPKSSEDLVVYFI